MLLCATEPPLHASYTLNSQNQQSAILCRLGASEQHEPQRTAQSRTNGQSEGSKREGVEENA